MENDPTGDSARKLSDRLRQRFVFLEQRLYWEGRIGRSDLVERFAISPAQASVDIASYVDSAPDNMDFDRSLKEYVASSRFVPRYFVPDARKYLTQLLLIADNALAPAESWLGVIPAHDAVARVRRKLAAETLQPIVLAIRRRRAIEIRYQSFSSPEPEVRWIAPHALVFDGSRWHARAWCYKKSMFGDFVLARTLWTGDTKPADVNSKLDGEWQRIVTIRLGTNPNLSAGQRRALELDYGMTDGIIEIPMRLCTVFYFERHMGLDLPESVLPAGRRQIIWLNRPEIEAIRQDLLVEPQA